HNEHHARRGLEAFNENTFQRFFGWKALVVGETAKARPLHQHDINVLRRLSQHSFKQFALSAMSTQITRIEQPSSVCFDLQRVGVKAGMIDKMRRDGEGANR